VSFADTLSGCRRRVAKPLRESTAHRGQAAWRVAIPAGRRCARGRGPARRSRRCRARHAMPMSQAIIASKVAGPVSEVAVGHNQLVRAGLTSGRCSVAYGLFRPGKGKLQRDLAASVLAEMVGALLLSRCATDDTASGRILERARRQVSARAAQ
jgi:hypothetical protein